MTARPRYLLVVDSEPDFLLFMRELLQDEGHRVATAESPESARAQLRHTRPDLLITDLTLWSHDPDTVVELLSAEPRLVGVPILICSAAAHELDVVAARARADGLEVLGKPFTIEDLLERIERLLAHPGGYGHHGGSMD
jgi:two-component system response regulator VicR